MAYWRPVPAAIGCRSKECRYLMPQRWRPPASAGGRWRSHRQCRRPVTSVILSGMKMEDEQDIQVQGKLTCCCKKRRWSGSASLHIRAEQCDAFMNALSGESFSIIGRCSGQRSICCNAQVAHVVHSLSSSALRVVPPAGTDSSCEGGMPCLRRGTGLPEAIPAAAGRSRAMRWSAPCCRRRCAACVHTAENVAVKECRNLRRCICESTFRCTE